jgi:hypothetical protein
VKVCKSLPRGVNSSNAEKMFFGEVEEDLKIRDCHQQILRLLMQMLLTIVIMNNSSNSNQPEGDLLLLGDKGDHNFKVWYHIVNRI